jgi:hypothetical protein
MTTNRPFVAAIALCALLLVPGFGSAAPLTAADMYLSPSAVPSSNYDYDYFSPGSTATYANVISLKVMPAFQSDGVTPYAQAAVDYTGDITGSNGSITFYKPGPYFVQATYTDNSQQLFDYGIQSKIRDNPMPPITPPTQIWRQIPTPAPDVVITGPDLSDSDPTFPQGTVVVHNLTTWDEVMTYIKTLTNKHVELGGHGMPGLFVWNGTPILNGNTPSTDGYLDQMKGRVNNLTFMSCLTGQGDQGAFFLQNVANKLGRSEGYDESVMGNGTDWFINRDGEKRIFIGVPEPAALAMLVLGLFSLYSLPTRSNFVGRPRVTHSTRANS